MKVVAFPKDSNPYQDLLYGAMPAGIDVTYLTPDKTHLYQLVTVLPRTIMSMIRLRLSGHKVFHVHWVYPFYFPPNVPFGNYLAYLYVDLFFVALKLLGFRVVWTVHNVIPQNPATSNDKKLMQKLSRLAAAKIVHASSVIDEMKRYKMDTSNISVIPIGSYGSLYPDSISVKQARRSLHIGADEFVVLFFGIISPYKGVEDLIEAFKACNLPNARLLIVGKCRDEALRANITTAAQDARIDAYVTFVPDDEVAKYFKAADVVCLPFRTITTSSSVMLAMAFGKPIIAPRLGALNDLPDEVGYLYDATDKQALSGALRYASIKPDELHECGVAARKYSDSLSWDKIAAQTSDVYKRLENL